MGLWSRPEGKMMIYVVEIESVHGNTATKEYEANSMREVARHVEADLWDYPGFHVVNVTAEANFAAPQSRH
jgi:hypothetical protein